MSTIKRPPAFRRHFVACSPLDFARLVAAVKTLQTWADEREAAAAASSDDDDSDNDGEGSSPFKSRAASAKSTRAPSAKAPESQEATPRSLREAAGEVMVNFRKKSNPLAFDGATLTAMLCQVEQASSPTPLPCCPRVVLPRYHERPRAVDFCQRRADPSHAPASVKGTRHCYNSHR